MKIEGIQKLTLLDFPGRVACTVFTPGCNFRCPFCHNADVVLEGQGGYPEEEILEFLESRKGKLTGVAVSGGEPMLQEDLSEFIRKVRSMGYAVKLDTNGSFPDKLKALVRDGLLDYVAMDIKNSRESYAATCGLDEAAAEIWLPKVFESAEFLMSGAIDFEFRTTVVKQLHTENDFRLIGEWLKGNEKFFLQSFVDSGNIMEEGLCAHEKTDMERFCSIMKETIPNTSLRGI